MSCVDNLASQFNGSAYYNYPVAGTIVAYQGYMGIPQYYKFVGTNEYLFGIKFIPQMFDQVAFQGNVWVLASPGVNLNTSYITGGGLAIEKIKIWTLYNIADTLNVLNMLAQIMAMIGMFGSMFSF